jgi:hypothetical protein
VAGRGRTPKDPSTRRRRNADTPTTELASDGRMRGPQLPKGALPDGEDWSEQTKAWWTNWRKSAQAQQFTATDWSFLLVTALMHQIVWSKGRWEFAAELRLREAKLGATAEDRLRLHMTTGPKRSEPAGVPAGVSDIQSRRERLLRVDYSDIHSGGSSS